MGRQDGLKGGFDETRKDLRPDRCVDLYECGWLWSNARPLLRQPGQDSAPGNPSEHKSTRCGYCPKCWKGQDEHDWYSHSFAP